MAEEEPPPPSGVVPLHDTVAEVGKASVKRRETCKQTGKLVVAASSLGTFPSEASNTISDGYAPGCVVPLHDIAVQKDGKHTLTAQQQRRIDGKRLEAPIRQEERAIGNRSANLIMHKIDKQWCKDEEEEEHVRKVQNFLRNLHWRKKEDARDGITWIELYALYSIRGGIEDEEEKTELPPSRSHTSWEVNWRPSRRCAGR